MCASALALAAQRGIIVLRRLPESGPWFAPRCPTLDNAVFSRDSFAACDRRDVELSFLPPTPCAIGLREPNRSLRVLTFSVARWCSPGPSTPRSARARPPKEPRSNATVPGPSVPVVGLGPRAFRPRMPSVGLTSPCGQVSRARPTVRKNASRLEHHLRCRWMTRLVRVMGRHRRLFRDCPRRFRR